MPTLAELREMGNRGERFFRWWSKYVIGSVAIQSEDKYDQEKDFIFQGQKAEIKTSDPYNTCPFSSGPEPGATVLYKDCRERSNQLRKCQETDRLFFVLLANRMYYPYVRIAEVLKPRKFEFITTPSGEKMAFKISEMKLLYKTDDPIFVWGLSYGK